MTVYGKYSPTFEEASAYCTRNADDFRLAECRLGKTNKDEWYAGTFIYLEETIKHRIFSATANKTTNKKRESIFPPLKRGDNGNERY